jgi:hypothetical protein
VQPSQARGARLIAAKHASAHMVEIMIARAQKAVITPCQVAMRLFSVLWNG